MTEHTAEELIAQRIYALALGYEDLNDNDELRNDPLLAVMVGKSTLNRLELTPVRANKSSRYKKITVDKHAVNAFFTNVFLQSYNKPPPMKNLMPKHYMKSNTG